MKIGIIGAMESEVASLKKMLEGVKVTEKTGMKFFEGRLSEKDVVVVRSGVGKVNSAICAQILIDTFKVTHIINTGAAGSLNAEINIGDIVLATDSLQHDMDCVGFGYPIGKIPFMKDLSFPGDMSLISRAKEVCLKVNPDINVYTGRTATGDQFICSREKKDFIINTFDAPLCCDMEGASIAQTAYLNSIPVLVLRSISDKADQSAEMDYPTFEKLAVEHTIRLLQELLAVI